MAYIYKIVNDINNKVQIGKTDRTIEKRFQEHCNDRTRRELENRPLYRAMNKYGIEHFHIELIEETNSPEEREIYWIKQYGSYHDGYNATMGGDGKPFYDYDLIYQELLLNPCEKDVAEKIGCSVDTIRTVVKKYGVKLKISPNVNSPKRVSQYDKKGNFIKTFDSIKEAAEECILLGVCNSPSNSGGIRSHIAQCAKGIRYSAYGFIWKYADE